MRRHVEVLHADGGRVRELVPADHQDRRKPCRRRDRGAIDGSPAFKDREGWELKKASSRQTLFHPGNPAWSV